MNGKDIQLKLTIEKECDSINLEFLKTVGMAGFGDKFNCLIEFYLLIIYFRYFPLPAA